MANVYYFRWNDHGHFLGLSTRESRQEIITGLRMLEREVRFQFKHSQTERGIQFQFTESNNPLAAWHNPEIVFSSTRRVLFKTRPRLIQSLVKHELLHAFGFRAKASDRHGHSPDQNAISNIKLSSDYFSVEEFTWLHRRYGKPTGFWPIQLRDIGDRIRAIGTEIRTVKVNRSRYIALRNNEFDRTKRQEHHKKVVAANNRIGKLQESAAAATRKWLSVHQQFKGIIER